MLHIHELRLSYNKLLRWVQLLPHYRWKYWGKRGWEICSKSHTCNGRSQDSDRGSLTPEYSEILWNRIQKRIDSERSTRQTVTFKKMQNKIGIIMSLCKQKWIYLIIYIMNEAIYLIIDIIYALGMVKEGYP